MSQITATACALSRAFSRATRAAHVGQAIYAWAWFREPRLYTLLSIVNCLLMATNARIIISIGQVPNPHKLWSHYRTEFISHAEHISITFSSILFTLRQNCWCYFTVQFTDCAIEHQSKSVVYLMGNELRMYPRYLSYLLLMWPNLQILATAPHR